MAFESQQLFAQIPFCNSIHENLPTSIDFLIFNGMFALVESRSAALRWRDTS